MEGKMLENGRERMRRPIRNKRYSRRAFGEDKRPPKRLFTPEIKRFLKDWLVRRRENPYPNRDEKKMLAIQTGLTYIQVCNWFANWRRKLKNAGKEPQRRTWGDLIKTYNNQVQGNVEHFSICSDDSIWEEQDDEEDVEDDKFSLDKQMDSLFNQSSENQCYFISSTTDQSDSNPFTAKYKNHIMEKYLKDCQTPEEEIVSEEIDNKPAMISKWLESAANFKPSENSYLDWTFQTTSMKRKKRIVTEGNLLQIHGREELDAAEALTTLANAKNCHIQKT